MAQWTPAKKLTNWRGAHGYNWSTLEGQRACLYNEMTNPVNHPQELRYPYRMAQNTHSTEAACELGVIFCYNFEDPNTQTAALRGEYAQNWHDALSGTRVIPIKPASINPYPVSSNSRAVQAYTVQSGDTPGAIAGRYGVTVSQLFQWNNITNLRSVWDKS